LIYVYGEKAPDSPKTSMPTFSSMEALAVRFGINIATVYKYAQKAEWSKKREVALQVIQENAHRAMLQQLTDQYVPVRAGLGAIVANSLPMIQKTLQGDSLDAARVVGQGLTNVDKALRSMNAIMGIPAPPPVAIQNNLFVMPPKADPEDETPAAPPPEHAALQYAGSMWSVITGAREVGGGLPPERVALLEEESTLPAHLSSVPRG
jgi:hypothetical protein